AAGEVLTVTAIVTDQAGNSSEPTTVTATVGDITAPDAPTVTIGDGDATINGFDLADNGQVTVTVELEAGTSIDDLISINGGVGVTVTQAMLDEGYVTTVPAPAAGEVLTVTAIVTDQAGNSSEPTTVTATVGDIDASVIDARDDLDSLDLELQTDISVPINRTETTIVEALGGSNGSNSNLNFTVSDNTNGTVNIEVAESAVVQVADAISLEIYDSNDNLLYVAANGNNPLVGNVLGLEILGLTNNNGGLTATLSGLGPGDYKVVVSKDSSTLENLINDLSVAELGEAGVVLGPDNQTAILDAVRDSLGFPLGGTVRATLALALNLTTDIGVGEFLSIAQPILITADAPVDLLLDAVAAEVLSNTLSLLETTEVTATLTEYSFADDTEITGNVIDPDQGLSGELGEDVVTPNTKVTEVNGVSADVNTGIITVNGQYGVLEIDADGDYTYTANGDYSSSGQSDTFTYTIYDSVTGDSDTAELGVDLAYTVDMAGGDDVVNITNNVLQSPLDGLDDNANTINIDSALNVNIIGGEGFDTINLTGSGQTLSLSDIFQTEALDISGTGANTLLVQAADVINSGTTNPIYVRGGSDDTVDLGSNGNDLSDVGGTWSNVGAAPDTGYDVWQLGNDTSKQIYIDTDITVI
ncbi:beta strand repeat-containing protein, partial [Psychrobacter sp. NPDC078631]|uniref:beta strand repeat-containing protein n=1 Tax=Psychrobacter sp. NPDC078631 TaxID=3390666 RepID=UPI003CFF9962